MSAGNLRPSGGGLPSTDRLIVGLAGTGLHPAEAAWLRHHRPAGVLLFGRNVADSEQLAALCSRLHGLLPAEAEIVADHEGGGVSVLQSACGRPPAPATLGAVDDPELTRAVHAETGRRLRAVGIDRDLTPCADILVEPRNPIVGARAFGSNPALVARHVAAAVQGLAEGGVRACVKHWPGHGGTRGDSHVGAVAAGPQLGGVPFVAGVRAGADAVMLGHLARRAAEGEEASDRPATLDPVAVAAARAELIAMAPSPLGFPSPSRGESTRVPVEFWTDDVTMGAVRDGLATTGVVPLDPAPAAPAGTALPAVAGLVDCEALPLAWFAALAAAGCERWLVRGIPWGAFPLPTGPAADPDPAPAPPDHRKPDEGPYAEARRRAVPGSWTWSGHESLLWIDGTAGDHWGEADLGDLLAGRFAAVKRLSTAAGQDLDPAAWQNILISSHRPLPERLRDRLRERSRWGDRGSLLTMGHPGLAQELAGRGPGAGWHRLGLADVTAQDLEPALKAPSA